MFNNIEEANQEIERLRKLLNISYIEYQKLIQLYSNCSNNRKNES